MDLPAFLEKKKCPVSAVRGKQAAYWATTMASAVLSSVLCVRLPTTCLRLQIPTLLLEVISPRALVDCKENTQLIATECQLDEHVGA